MISQSVSITQSQHLRPLTTAHLAQTMSLLLLSNIDLKKTIEAELSTNPALQVTRTTKCPSCRRLIRKNSTCSYCATKSETADNSPVIFVSPRNDFNSSTIYRQSEENDIIEETIAAPDNLSYYVLRQIAPDLNREELTIAIHILSSLDDDGFLVSTPIEISNYNHIPLSTVNKILSQIQKSDPIGVASTSPKEALLVQLEALSETQKVPPYAQAAIQNGLELLGRHSYYELGKLLGISTEEADKTAKFIAENLNPYPARSFWGNKRTAQPPTNVVYSPDIILTVQASNPGKIFAEIIAPYTGLLQLNPLYRQEIKNKSSEKLEKWQTDYEKANLLIKCLAQRNNTMIRLVRLIINLQQNFILKGDNYLKPITRAFIAKELEVHESTISRAVSGKLIQLPNNRIIPFTRFFDRSLHIRAELVKIILSETEPLSDQRISELLNDQGYDVARRTVAKYRSIEGIMSARLRSKKLSQLTSG